MVTHKTSLALSLLWLTGCQLFFSTGEAPDMPAPVEEDMTAPADMSDVTDIMEARDASPDLPEEMTPDLPPDLPSDMPALDLCREASSAMLMRQMTFVEGDERSYVACLPNEGDDSCEGSAVFAIEVAATGSYVIDTLSYAPDGASDSFFVRANDGLEFLWDTSLGGTRYMEWLEEPVKGRGMSLDFSAPEFNPLVVELREGDNTLTFSSRDPRTRLSRVCARPSDLPVSEPTPPLPGLYVATNGKDTGDCTAENPCRSLRYASERSEPGDTIWLRAGTYEHARLGGQAALRKGGAPGNPLRISAYPDEEVIVQGAFPQDHSPRLDPLMCDPLSFLRFNLPHHQNIIVEGLTIRGFYNGFTMDEDAANISIVNNIIEPAVGDGVLLNTRPAADTSELAIVGNTFIGKGMESVPAPGTEICGRDWAQGMGVRAQRSSRHEVLIRNNIFRNMGRGALIGQANIGTIAFYHNTVLNTRDAGVTMGVDCARFHNCEIEIHDNIFAGTGGVSLLFETDAKLTHFNNLYLPMMGRAGPIQIDGKVLSITQCQNTVGQCDNSEETDPELVNDRGALKPGSPAIDAGSNRRPVARDRVGAPRKGTPDIGAREFNSP